MAEAPRTVVLTGASRGIGHATVRRFHAEGWRVITCSREALPTDCRGTDGMHYHIPADLADGAAVDRFVREANAILGAAPLHALVNNAGVSPKSPLQERLGCLNGDLALWRQVFDINLFAPIALARGFAPALTRGRGAIVHITSIAGYRVHPFAGSAYSTSKAALTALTRQMAAEFAHLGVRANAVAPGEIDTAILSPETEQLIPRIPLQRLGLPEDVAGCVYFLCGPDSAYITGVEIPINGGQDLF
jgi:NAD(P)-dependent dehydrogenase (short-subunit alcohol dehydrogenase family)